ncbi:immunoglobulin superfamily member 3-like [Hyperolius riggenbachi]|uniref:immunoglobulin superfamily member 3-like n=1 Tax=Hyperolius riggenbachi TaxID=752182 RepID=UPI0035A3CF0A
MSPPHRDRVWLLAAVLLLYSGGALSHHVSVPPGPLYRTEGSTLSLWCNTSSPSVAAYEWSMFPAHSPGRKLQIVSSADPGFSYAVFRDRVLDRRIYLERATEASTRLHMLRLQKEDAGEYECYAPSPTLRYYRSYCASVTLTVIPDSLHVSLLSPQELTLYTDDPLTLSCEVFSRTEQHTHFSVSWYRQDSAQPLLTLSELSVVSAGSPYKKRHQAGEIRLEKVSAILYHLIVSSLEPDDQAKYYCQATEWIQDPDKTWYPLTTKRSHGTRVHVVSPRSALLGGAAVFPLFLQKHSLEIIYTKMAVGLPSRLCTFLEAVLSNCCSKSAFENKRNPENPLCDVSGPQPGEEPNRCPALYPPVIAPSSDVDNALHHVISMK